MSDDWSGDDGDDRSSSQEDSAYFDGEDYSRSRSRSRSSHSSGSRSPSQDEGEFSGSHSSRSGDYSGGSGRQEGSVHSGDEDGSRSFYSSSRSRSQSGSEQGEEGFGESFHEDEHDDGFDDGQSGSEEGEEGFGESFHEDEHDDGFDDGGSRSSSQSDPDDYDGSHRVEEGSGMFNRIAETLDWDDGQDPTPDTWENENVEPTMSPSTSSRRDRRRSPRARSNHSRQQQSTSPRSNHSRQRQRASPRSNHSRQQNRGSPRGRNKRYGGHSNGVMHSPMKSPLPPLGPNGQKSPPPRNISNVNDHSDDIMFQPPSPSAFQAANFSPTGNAHAVAAKNSMDNLFPGDSPKPTLSDLEAQSIQINNLAINGGNVIHDPTIDFQQSLSEGLEVRKPDSNENKLRSSDPNIDFGGSEHTGNKDTFEDETADDKDNGTPEAAKGPKRESATQYERKKARKRYQRRAAASCILIAGIVVMVVLLAAKGKETYDYYYRSEAPSASPTESPTLLNDTLFENQTAVPTLPPRGDNIFDFGATSPPTVVNDECVGAISLSVSSSGDTSNADDTSNTGNTTSDNANATFIDNINSTVTTRKLETEFELVTAQGSTVDANEDWSNGLDACGTVHLNGHGVWYTVQVEGDTTLVASTCTESTWYDTQLSVYKIKLGDDDEPATCLSKDSGSHQLECITGNDQSGNSCGNTGDQSRLTWRAVGGTEYYILVHGFRGAAGEFELVVDKFAVENDLAENAIESVVEPTLDTSTDSTFGSTVGATIDTAVQELCEGSSEKGPGVWYKVNPEHVGAARATIFTEETGFDGELLVLKRSTATPDAPFECVDSGLGGDVLTWVALPRNEYYLLIRGRTALAEGDFGLRLYQRPSTGNRPPSNDKCPQATSIAGSISTPETIQGDTSFATREDLTVASCGHLVWLTAPGVWYTVESPVPDDGQSVAMTASVCTALPPSSLPSAKVSVFKGTSCDELECVDGHSPSPVFGHGDSTPTTSGCASITWLVEQNQQYRLLVHGYGAHEGLFDLTLITTVINTDLSTSECANAMGISVDEDSYKSIVGVLESSSGAGPFTCDSLPGSSSNSSNPDGNSVATGNFGAAWHQIVGTGRKMIASTCHPSTTFGAQIAVVFDDSSGNSTGCDNLVCADTSTLSTCSYGDQMTVTWNSIAGRLYFVLVHGLDGKDTINTNGDANTTQGGETNATQGVRSASRHFVLTLDETTINDSHDSAIGPVSLSLPIQPSGFDPLGERTTTYGSTRSSGIEYDLQALCPKSNILTGANKISPSRGVWYTVKGTGESLTASTCNQFTEFDSLISIFIQPGKNSSVATSPDGLECAGGEYSSSPGASSACSLSSTVTWTTETDVIYLVLVQGLSGDDFGNFGLRITK